MRCARSVLKSCLLLPRKCDLSLVFLDQFLVFLDRFLVFLDLPLVFLDLPLVFLDLSPGKTLKLKAEMPL
ncbi:hypothetical protein BOO69_07310 [Sulfitobacter alexandrii]|uniref:Uncharacterized protein n=1 Tax=Sulfitobacter alexandrii TaxID=1917485 RepID=A0A1J0WFY9_9RHOB|nr:hypothetical protein BOO69_07310 [Sulfitobacter alexandrii]